MILTLTPNPGIDYSLRVEEFRLNATLRADSFAWGMGGKATDAAWVLGQLGVPTLALGFAAGPTGKRMEKMLHERGVETDFVWVEGESRLNVVIVDSHSGQSTLTASSLTIEPGDIEDLMQRYAVALEKSACVILGGSLPAGVPEDFYGRAITQARLQNIPVIFDASGPAFRAGLMAHPSTIKPNQAELVEMLGREINSLEEIENSARQLKKEFGSHVIVTLGCHGALAVLDQRSYYIPPLKVPVCSTAGAGDGILAGLALAITKDEPPEQGLKYGFALAGAILQTLPTADFKLKDFEDLLPRVVLKSLEESLSQAAS